MPTLIKTFREFPSKQPSNKYAFVLCGFGGSIWQLKRLIRILNRSDYNVLAMDFPEVVLSKGDPALLPRLVDEVVNTVEAKRKELDRPILLVGVSLGALLSLNILRRSQHFNEGVLITGGDIVKVAQRLYGLKIWPQTYGQLAEIWKNVNMYTDPTRLKGKKVLMVLPTKDRLIDPDDVRSEVQRQQSAGNDLSLIERRAFGHVGTIIEEAVLFPRRTRSYITRVRS